MVLADIEVRRLAIDLLRAETDRDRQVRVGASNLSNGCQFCLASNLLGFDRATSEGGRAWGGRVLGTSIHATLESRMREAMKANRNGFAERFTGARIEQKLSIGTLGTYGDIYSTPDLVLPDRGDGHVFDWKGTTDTKMALMRDFQAISQGKEPPFGRLHKYIQVYTLNDKTGVYRRSSEQISQAVYDKEMAKQEYKLAGYYRQIQLYMRGLNLAGIPVTRGSIVLISRDNSMWFDNPESEGFVDESKLHGVNVISFTYSLEFAESVWEHGIRIWDALEGGASVDDFPRHPLCFPCSIETRGQDAEVIALPGDDVTITVNGLAA